MKKIFSFVIVLLLIASCQKEKEPLKILNRAETIDGKKVYETIPDFSFVNQDSETITNATFKDKVYVVNYFFTSCTTICPRVSKQLVRVYERFKDDDRMAILSTSIDTRHDTIPKLKRYAEKLEVSAPRWNFVTGDEKEIYDIAKSYFITALKDPGIPDGYDHDDLLVLVDKNRHIRSFCHGTEPESVDKFMEDIAFLLETEYSEGEGK